MDVGRERGVRTSFFDQWQVYPQIVRHDYMSHRSIHRAIRSVLVDRQSHFSVLDLGCGDASGTAETLQGLPVTKYTGVDGSEAALAQAKQNLTGSGVEIEFIQSDVREFLAEPGPAPTDVVIVGFVAHHLKDDEKSAFLTDCFMALHDGGVLFYYDVFRRRDESLDSYLDAYGRLIKRDWHALSDDDKTSVIEHIREFDFPAEYEYLARMAAEAGFETPREPLFADEPELHRLYSFRKGC